MLIFIQGGLTTFVLLIILSTNLKNAMALAANLQLDSIAEPSLKYTTTKLMKLNCDFGLTSFPSRKIDVYPILKCDYDYLAFTMPTFITCISPLALPNEFQCVSMHNHNLNIISMSW